MNALVRPPLDGEVIAPGESLSVLAFMHPLKADHRLVLVPIGSTLAEIVKACERECVVHRLADGVRVKFNGDVVPREHWHLIRPKAGTHVAVHAVPKGFLVPLALTALSTTLTNLGFSAFVTGLITGAVGLVAQLAISALFPPAGTKTAKQKQTYSISGPRNEIAPWGPIPTIFGTVRASPKYCAQYFTRFEGDDQYVYLLFVHGFGPLDIEEQKFGNTLINSDNFDDVTIQTFPGRMVDGKPDHYKQTLIRNAVIQDDLNVTITKDDGPVTRSSGENAVRLEWDIVFPNGLFELKDDGYDDQFIKFQILYRLIGTTSWLVVDTVEMRADSPDVIRLTRGIDVADGQYEGRVAKLSDDYDEDDEDNHSTRFDWTAFRTIRDSKPIDFPIPLAITAIKIKATDQLNGVPDDFNAKTSSRAKSWNGSSWVSEGRTRNPGDLFRLILQGPANKRPVPDAKIDLAAVQAWASRCTAKGFTFDMARDFRSSVWEAARDVCAAGRAVPLFRDGIWSVAYERQGDPIVQHFTPRNSWSMRRRHEYKRLPDALRVKFQNADKGYAEDEMLVFPVGSSKNKNSANLQTEQIEFPGVTSKAAVTKLARYMMATTKLRPATFTLSSDDHLVCSRGDRVYIANDMLMNTLGFGRVKSVSGSVVTLDQPVLMEPGKTYGMRFRGRNGVSFVRQLVTVPGQSFTITLSGSGQVPTVPDNRSAGDMWSYGPLGQEAGVYRVREIRHNDDLSAELELVDDAPTIEDADTADVGDYDSGIVEPIDPTQFPSYDLAVSQAIDTVGAAFVTTVSWKAVSLLNVRYFIVEGRSASGTRVRERIKASQLFVTFKNLARGEWTFRVLSEFTDTRRNRWSARTTVELALPPDPNYVQPRHLKLTESIQGPGKTDFAAVLTWDVNTEVGIDHFEVYITGADGDRKLAGRPALSNKRWDFGTLVPGAYTFRVRTVLVTGQRYSWSDEMSVKIVSYQRRPPRVDNFEIDLHGEVATLTWDASREPVLGYGLRYSPETSGVVWEDMARLASVYATSYEIAAQDGTYAIKARSYGETSSEEATYITVTNTDVLSRNVVQTIFEPGTWLGGRSATVVDNGELRLTFGGNAFKLVDFFGVADFFAPGGQPSFTRRGTYRFNDVIDLGAVYTSRVEPKVLARGTIATIDTFEFEDFFGQGDFFGFDRGDWDAYFEIRTTNADPASDQWSDYRRLRTGDVRARAMQFRLALESMAAGVTPRVRSARVTVDMPDRLAAAKDLIVGTSGRTITFAKAFRELRGISIAAQDMAAGDYPVITAKNEFGFTIVFRNSAAAAVSRTFDYTAIGYGVRL